MLPIDDYANNDGPGEVRLLCSFYHEPLHTWIKTTVNKFAISHYTASILGVHALRSSPCIMYVQYIGGCSVHRGVFSTSGGVQYIGGCSVHRGDTMSTSGGYHEYIGGIS